MPSPPSTQLTKALALLRRNGLTRLSKFRQAGITATTISRLEAAGTITRLARGLYQLSDAAVGQNHALAEAHDVVRRSTSSDPGSGTPLLRRFLGRGDVNHWERDLRDCDR